MFETELSHMHSNQSNQTLIDEPSAEDWQLTYEEFSPELEGQLFASAGMGEAAKLGEITEQHFDKIFGLNTRGTLFTVQKALPLFNDGGSIFMTGSIASVKGRPDWAVYSTSKAGIIAF
jgi:NAD(P)-dependent dehydrogenase (short-subunit alcohol dehydrogenase family)